MVARTCRERVCPRCLSLAATAPAIASIVAVLGPSAATAHHHRINFSDTAIALHGRVAELEWKNPHVYVYLDAEMDNGETVRWEIESASTPSLTRRGVRREALAAGKLLTIRGLPDRDPARMRLFAQSITTTNGTTFALTGPNLTTSGPEARASSLQGIWATIGNPYDRTRAATHLPLTEKGKAAAAMFDVSNDPTASCVPPPVPDSLTTPYLHEIVLGEDTIILREEYWEVERIVYMDGRPHPQDGPRTNQGHSIGRWEGDVLVVDTVLFEDHAFGNGSGIPSGPQKHTIEHYALSDDGTTITIDYTLEDPEYLAAPVRDTRKWRYTPHLELLPNQCDLETARRYIATD